MSKVRIITGNEAAALAVILCEPQVVAAYPITPQTRISELLSEYVENGTLKAEYVRVESEHSALSVLIAASTAGVRTFTATSANGLLYMHEQLHWAAGSRLPIVMCCVNRGVAAPWSIFNDQQDSMSQRDTGWIQLYCRNNQEIIDTVVQAYRIAEEIYAPVMVCYDGFTLSHTMMPVEIPEAGDVKRFLPPYRPHTFLDPERPRTINPVFFPNRRYNDEGVLCDGYMEMRRKLQNSLERAKEVITEVNRDFGEQFGRDYGGLIWSYRTEDADVILAGMGSIAAETTLVADLLRNGGVKAGVVGIRSFRPFPREALALALKQARFIMVFEKCLSYGYEGGLTSDLKAALYGSGIDAPIIDFIAGLGGRDVTTDDLLEASTDALERYNAGDRANRTVWINCQGEEE
ncbi:MAG: pyruvate ferredoxin oxidoreductase [Syntrophales bacterium]|jgi:pyruvate/2-oxoacid:ferredoxin oxidoreductase alpha subunit|nr:pyruvate ferredoxin oxidoreductase [Syntrophales bacterium]MCK9527746.1 pyruvate ferredoxin oxidoreductase [Syntrophales bacterium]MDX9921599.1 transketolase C-terminal domain-containing protein [Syntrophales bacterium]